MKWLVFEYHTFLEFDVPVTEHQFVLRCAPPSSPRQRIANARVQIRPTVPYSTFTDGFGNLVLTGCVPYEHTSFHYSTNGEAFVSESNREIGLLNPVFKYPSRLTKPSDEMVEFCRLLKLPKDNFGKAIEIMHAIHGLLKYKKGETDIETSAAEAFSKRIGVCQDFSHTFISLARLSGLPARYASGLVLGEGPTHSWAEVYFDGAWHGYDATGLCEAGESYIRFCVGRDYGDCPIERGVFTGPTQQSQMVDIKVFEGESQQ